MKSSILSLALFFILFAFAAKSSLASRNQPIVLHTDGMELNSDSTYHLVACKGKNSWPELVGENGEAAAVKIEKENPHVNAIVILEGSPIILNFRCDRVWVVVDNDGKVVQVPRIG